MEPDRPIQPGPGQCGCDRDTFLRVWRRVMPEDTPACPIAVEEMERAVPAMVPAAQPAPAPPRTEGAGDDFPDPRDVPCLGSSSAVYSGTLQEFISRSLKAWKEYQLLAKRVSGSGGRMLSLLAGDQRRHAKRLSAALFLITGVRFWPAERMRAQGPSSYRGALREHFVAEQRMEEAYRMAMEDCHDPCLRALFGELAEECAGHAAYIRGLLETL